MPLSRRFAWMCPFAAAVLVIAALAPTAVAEQAIITTTDGNQISGELVSENDDEVVLSISGIRTTISRERIESIDIQPTIEEVYRQRRAELEDDDLDGRYDLAYDLYRQNALDLALRELADLVERFPDEQRVERLQRVVEQRKQMLEEREAEQPRERPTARERQPAPRAQPAASLTPAQINMIRVYEIDLEEEPRIQIPNPVLDEFLAQYADRDDVPSDRTAQARFKRAEGFRQLELMFNVRAREFYDEVIVRQDPPVMRAFRTRLHNQYVLGYCATSECHGSADAPGNLRLVRGRPTSTETVYTNFYLLNEYRSDAGSMINRGEPTQSLLLQYGLPRDVAERPHPEVERWTPRFTGVDDRFFQRYAQILDELWSPRPDYGIDFTPAWEEADEE
ncbi:MAG: hypothetical protein ACODAQ_01660 [Phycisphaeraceae bacterium]